MNSSASAVSPSTGLGLAADLADWEITARLRAADYRAWRAQVAGHRRLRRPDPPHRLLPSSTGTAPSCSNAPGPCSPPAATAAPRSARPARTATPPTPTTSCAPDWPETTPRACRRRSSSTRARSSPSPRPRSGRCTPASSPAAGTSSPAAAGTATTPTTPASAPPLDPDATTTKGRCCGRPTPGCCGPGSPPPCAAPWPPRSASGPATSPTSPAVLRQGRRVPTPRARALPRRHPPRRPRRTHRPTTGRAHPRRAARRHHHRRPRRRCSPRPAGRDPAACSAGVPSSTCAPSPPAAPRQLEDAARGDHRRRVGRLHRQVRHQGHRRPPRAPTGRSATGPTSSTSTSPAPPPHDRNRMGARRPRPSTTALNLRRWAHMLGFRGHFLTKSRAYSTTFTAIRAATPHLAAARRPRPARPRHRQPGRRVTGRPRHRHRGQRLVCRPHRPPRPRRTRTRPGHRRTQPDADDAPRLTWRRAAA